MTAIEFLKRLGCKDLKEGYNGILRATYRDFIIVESRPGERKDKLNIIAIDTHRNPKKEISHVGCHKSLYLANSSTVKDFKFRIDQLIERTYEDRDKIVLGTEVDVGKRYWSITDLGKEDQICLIEIINISINGIEAKPIKFHKNFSNFFDVDELVDVKVFDKDAWFTSEINGPFVKDKFWNLCKIPEDDFFDLENFLIYKKIDQKQSVVSKIFNTIQIFT